MRETSNAVSWFGKFAELLRVLLCRFGCGACVAGFVLIALGASVCVLFVGLSRLDLFLLIIRVAPVMRNARAFTPQGGRNKCAGVGSLVLVLLLVFDFSACYCGAEIEASEVARELSVLA